MIMKNKKQSDVETLALKFNNCINNQDIEGLAELMTDGHEFIDSENNRIYGKENNIKNWQNFFELFPFYRNIFEKITSDNDTVFMEGYSVCSDEILNNVKAIWVAKTGQNKVKEWRIYNDTKKNRIRLSL